MRPARCLKLAHCPAQWPVPRRPPASARCHALPGATALMSDWLRARPRPPLWAFLPVRPEDKVSSLSPASWSSPRCCQTPGLQPLRVGSEHVCLPLPSALTQPLRGCFALCPLPGGEGRAQSPTHSEPKAHCPAAEIRCQRFDRDTEGNGVMKPHSEKPHRCSVTFAPPVA